jgi:hypothetical protein
MIGSPQMTYCAETDKQATASVQDHVSPAHLPKEHGFGSAPDLVLRALSAAESLLTASSLLLRNFPGHLQVLLSLLSMP